MTRPLETKFGHQPPQGLTYQQHAQQQHQQHAIRSGVVGGVSGGNHNRVSPGPMPGNVGNVVGGSGPGGVGGINSRSNTMVPKNSIQVQQSNRNPTQGHTCMTQPAMHQAPHPQQNFYPTHPNALSGHQGHKGPGFGPANGGYPEGGITSAYGQVIFFLQEK